MKQIQRIKIARKRRNGIPALRMQRAGRSAKSTLITTKRWIIYKIILFIEPERVIVAGKTTRLISIKRQVPPKRARTQSLLTGGQAKEEERQDSKTNLA